MASPAGLVATEWEPNRRIFNDQDDKTLVILDEIKRTVMDIILTILGGRNVDAIVSTKRCGWESTLKDLYRFGPQWWR